MRYETKLRILIIVQITLFIIGALAHTGNLPLGYAHAQAMRAETIIAVILLIGLASTFWVRAWNRKVVLSAEVIALLGTLMGLVMIFIGVGPRTSFDLILHAAMILSVSAGIWLLLGQGQSIHHA